jgi:hypothetical protein
MLIVIRNKVIAIQQHRPVVYQYDEVQVRPACGHSQWHGANKKYRLWRRRCDDLVRDMLGRNTRRQFKGEAELADIAAFVQRVRSGLDDAVLGWAALRW